MNIYIPIEIKVRDLEGRGLLAFSAAERGHTVIFGAKEDTRVMARKGELAPGVVHNKSLTPSPSSIRMLDELNNHGHLVTSQDEESGLLDESYDYFARQRFSESTIGKTTRVFAWGEHDASSLQQIYGMHAGRITVTGSPRVDFWRREFMPFFKRDEFDPHENGRPYILIASNFGTLLNENQIWNRFARMREAGYYKRDPEKEFHDYKYAAYHLSLIGEFVKMIRTLAVSMPDVTVLVRPHPVESMDAWRKLIGEYPNIMINRQGSISGWIRNSLMLVHNGCTSALEAAACDIPRIAYRPSPSEYEREMPNRISFNVHSLDELQGLVSDLMKGRNIPDQQHVDTVKRDILESRFANLSGPLAADRIVDLWEKDGSSMNIDEIPYEQAPSEKTNQPGDVIKRIKRPLVRMRDSLLFSSAKREESHKLLRSAHKFSGLEESEIFGLSKNLQETLDRFHNVEYKRTGKRSFKLFSKSPEKNSEF